MADFVSSPEIRRGWVDHPDRLNAVVTLFVGDNMDNITAENTFTDVRSFSFERLTNGVGNFTMTLVDPNWISLEKALLEAKGKLFFQYGYENSLSSVYTGLLVGLELEPYLNYVVVHLSGLTTESKLITDSTFMSSALQNTSSTDVSDITQTTLYNKGFGVKQRKISDLVTDLAKLAGYTEDSQRIIDETTEVEIKDSMFSTEDSQKILTSKGLNLFTFIVRRLLPLAVHPDDAAAFKKQQEEKSTEPITTVPFVFYTDVNSDNKQVFHFHKQDKFKDNPVKAIFNLYSEPDTRIISYKPSYEHMIANLTRGTSIYAWTYSPMSGAEFEEKAVVKQSPTAIQPYYSYDYNDPKAGAVKTVSYSPDPMITKVEVARAAQMAMNAPITADLVIVGDSGYNLTDVIYINVNIPHGSSAGRPHNTTNRYMILGITDTIDLGVFTTSLKLGTAVGSVDKAQNNSRIINEDQVSKDKAAVEQGKQRLIE